MVSFTLSVFIVQEPDGILALANQPSGHEIDLSPLPRRSDR